MIERPVRCNECICCSIADDHLICSRIAEIMDGYYRGTVEVVKPDDYCSKGIRKSSAGCKVCAPVKELENELAIDAEIVRHGQWIQSKIVPAYHHCSICGVTHKMQVSCNKYILFRYCPNCGAKMDGGSYG